MYSDLWIEEKYKENLGLRYKVKRTLFSGKSEREATIRALLVLFVLLLILFVGLVLLVGRVILFLLQPACLSTVPPTTSTSAAAAALRVPSRPWASTREPHPHPPLQQKSSTRAAHQRRCRTTHPTPSPPTPGGNASLQRPGIRSQASCHPDPPLQPARTQTTPLPTAQARQIGAVCPAIGPTSPRHHGPDSS